ncbi:LYR motif-containing protein bcn92 [Leptinotarsa decemlineata]|uniref:LYR motif-containing protein bcn92 n=1 Tax=Leptinotarsa decemlineata TaxID=7539 RepID=UPI000C253D7A|nr:protein bcn92 [Leptinotarsa decemlineata]
MATKTIILRLYKAMLKESQKIPAYNFRKYAIRRVRDGFRANKYLSNSDALRLKVEEAETNLEVIRRQVIVGQLYTAEKLVIEHQSK